MITVIDDGVWCPSCKKFHPTLRWHERYGIEESQSGIINRFKRNAEKRPEMFGFKNKSKDEKEKSLNDTIKINLEYRQIADAQTGDCVICGYPTAFISKKTGRHVCSDECLYKENGWKEVRGGHSNG